MNIEADPTSKCFASDEILINSSVEKVFETLSDINNWPKWQSAVSKANIIGKPEVGKEFKWKSGGLNIKSRLHTVTPNKEIGWTGRIWWITAIHNWYLSDENGKTKVVVKESLKGLGASRMQNSLRKGMADNLAELKRTSEK